MKKSINFLHSEAFRRTFLSYLLIALLFSGMILGFMYRDLYQTARERFIQESVKASEDMDRKAGELVRAVDQFSARLYSEPGVAEDFFRFFGATAEEYTSRRLELSGRPETDILTEFKSLVIRSNYSIRHIICYSRDNITDLEYNDRGDSRHRIITAEEAARICRSGCVYQTDILRVSLYLGKIAVVADVSRFVNEEFLKEEDRGIFILLPSKTLQAGSMNLSSRVMNRILRQESFPCRYTEENLSLYCASYGSKFLPFSLIYMTKTEVLFADLFLNFWLLVLCFFLAFGAISAVLIRRFSGDSKYLSTILSSMERAEQENFEPLKVPGKIPEYDAIIRGLNDLYAHLDSLIQQEYKLTISQQKAQMDMLSAQLSPHFLYNTLERIRMRAVLDKAPDVAEATAGLGLLYRNIVKTPPVIPLSREAEITRQYLDLMTFLYGDQLLYHFDIDPSLLNMSTPKIWMQPIVENFFKHNFRQDDQIKVVVVELTALEDGFEGRFFDNIGSMDQEKLDSINRQLRSEVTEEQGMGLKNVLYRLQLYYGAQLEMTMENNDPSGISIHIVCRKEGKGRCIDS